MRRLRNLPYKILQRVADVVPQREQRDRVQQIAVKVVLATRTHIVASDGLSAIEQRLGPGEEIRIRFVPRRRLQLRDLTRNIHRNS